MPTKREKLQQIQQTNFTGRQQEIEFFKSLLPLDRNLSIDVLVVYGIGGIGKSELLNQFQRLCQEAGILIVRLDPQVQASIFDFLMSLYHQLGSHLQFPEFEEGLKRLQSLEMKLLGHADIPRTVLKTFARGALGAMKLVPGANVIAEAISSEQIDSAMNSIYSAVGRKDGEFWMKPEEEMTERLLADMSSFCSKNRLVIIVDTYELMDAFDEWTREQLLSNLSDCTLLIIASRHRLEGAGWQEYAPLMRQIELKSFTVLEAQAYIQKKGVSEAQMVAAMVDYADGHPLTLALLADLAGQIDVKDLTRTPERRRVITTLLERITHHVTANLRAALETCAILRVVNEDSLAHMLQKDDIQQMFDQVRRFDFVKLRNGGIALHDAVWAAMNEELCWRSPSHYRDLNKRAIEFYDQVLARPNVQESERLILERLYHHIRADETSGIQIFQEMAEECVRYQLLHRLRTLLNDVNNYTVDYDNSRLWIEYYHARMKDLQARFADAEISYAAISQNENAESKLRSYALSDLAYILKRHQRYDQAIPLLEKSLLVASIDSKLAINFLELSEALQRKGDLDESLKLLDKAKEYYHNSSDKHGLVYALNRIKSHYLNQGLIREALSTKKEVLQVLGALPTQPISLKMEVLGDGVSLAWAWYGRLQETEREMQDAFDISQRLQVVDDTSMTRNLGCVLGLQGKYEEADKYFTQSIEALKRFIMPNFPLDAWLSQTSGLRGHILIRRGLLVEAEEELNRSLEIKLQVKDLNGAPELLMWMGELNQVKYQLIQSEEKPLLDAEVFYRRCIDLKWLGRRYFICGVLSKLAHVKYLQGAYEAVPSIMVDAEKIAHQYQYNDHLALLWLTKGYIGSSLKPESKTSDKQIVEIESDAVLKCYQYALVYALRFNRFLLDEILWGGNVATSFQPIIPHCLKQGEEGQRMLVALLDWWLTGANNADIASVDFVSPLPTGIPLLEAERMARNLEPGDASPQTRVIEHIKFALIQH